MKDKLWFFTSARYFSVNNFIANTFIDDGSQGVDDQFIKSAMARLTWQVSPRNKITGVLRRDRQVSRPRHAGPDDPETAARRWFSPAYHTTAVKWTSPVTSRLFFEAGWSSNLEYYTNSYQDGIEKPRGHGRWFAGARRERARPRRLPQGGTDQHDREPGRASLAMSRPPTSRAAHPQVRLQQHVGHFIHTRDANADLVQQYRSTSTGIPLHGARHRAGAQHAAARTASG